MKWISDLKLAIIQKDITTIGKLIKDVPQITEMNEAKKTLALINEAINIVENEKSKALVTMNKIKQTKAFLESN